ncbi:MAG: TIGR00282 family metallophosphoesterase [Synergistales bacterium]
MKILFIGDIVGSPGRKALAEVLPRLRKEWGPLDFVLANGENAAAGFGLTDRVFSEILDAGVDCLTSGNHVWDKRDFLETLAAEKRIIRPANYPPGCPGQGVAFLERSGKKLAVLNLQGRVFMPTIDCPFRIADSILQDLDLPTCVFVDFHAEATSEKKALGLYLDGRVSALVGTHTHVQTADESILPGGTAYLTDCGMTGGHGGVIGMRKEGVLPRFLTAMPTKFEVCEEALRLNAVIVEIDDETGKAFDIRRLDVPVH